MIKKSLLCFIVLVILHDLIVRINPTMGMATHQWQDNLIKAQSFLYADHVDSAMVGTSLSARIIRDSIPSIKSVSFGGCAVEDGLRIISNKDQLPQYIFVETNLLFTEGNKELVNKLTEGIIPRIKHWIPSLREQYEPICLLASLALKSGNVNPQAGAADVDMNILNESIRQLHHEDSIYHYEVSEERVKTVKGLIDSLEEKGVKVVFFEMPVNENISHLSKFEQTRKKVSEVFPKDKYCYLPSDTTHYLTTDGEHLSFEEQQRYSHFFKDLVSRKTRGTTQRKP